MWILSIKSNRSFFSDSRESRILLSEVIGSAGKVIHRRRSEENTRTLLCLYCTPITDCVLRRTTLRANDFCPGVHKTLFWRTEDLPSFNTHTSCSTVKAPTRRLSGV